MTQPNPDQTYQTPMFPSLGHQSATSRTDVLLLLLGGLELTEAQQTTIAKIVQDHPQAQALALRIWQASNVGPFERALSSLVASESRMREIGYQVRFQSDTPSHRSDPAPTSESFVPEHVTSAPQRTPVRVHPLGYSPSPTPASTTPAAEDSSDQSPLEPTLPVLEWWEVATGLYGEPH